MYSGVIVVGWLLIRKYFWKMGSRVTGLGRRGKN